MVCRQLVIHYGDIKDEEYAFHQIKKYVCDHLDQPCKLVADIGCGVGRLIRDIAADNTDGDFYGVDFSYQMLRQAYLINIEGKAIHLKGSQKGFKDISIEKNPIPNLQFALAKSESLPFLDRRLNVVISTLLWDRLEHPMDFLSECHRCLVSKGKFILVTPLNYQSKILWAKFYPVKKLIDVINRSGFIVTDFNESLEAVEVLDGHGNAITWKCIGIVAEKR